MEVTDPAAAAAEATRTATTVVTVAAATVEVEVAVATEGKSSFLAGFHQGTSARCVNLIKRAESPAVLLSLNAFLQETC